MTRPSTLAVRLLSHACFATGATSATVDIDIEHDELGLPVLGGRALHGLLADTWRTIAPHFPHLEDAARRLFGRSGRLDQASGLYVGSARTHPTVRRWVRAALDRTDDPLTALDVLEAATAVRTSTAIDRPTAAAAEGTLRAVRCVMPGWRLYAQLDWLVDLPDDEQTAAEACLAVTALGTRHAGLRRTRGMGLVEITFHGDLDRTRRAAEAARPPTDTADDDNGSQR